MCCCRLIKMWILIFLLLLLVEAEKYWVVKQERTKEKINFRVQLPLPNKKFVVYSKTRPNKHAVPYKTTHYLGALNVVNKECSSQDHNYIAPQVILGNTSCLILDSFNDTENPYTLYQLYQQVPLSQGVDITTIANVLQIPTSYTRTSNILTMVSGTGLDLNHCFFSDNNADTHFYTYFNLPLTEATDSDHAKVSAYIKCAAGDFVDQTGGHESHVAGIFGGKRCFSKHGIAPDARIVFVDLHSSGNYLMLPTNFIALLQTLDVRISSSSWGSYSTGQYDQVVFQIDYFVKNINPRHIPLVAAGNNCPPGYISSPAFADNAVSVGATDINGVIQAFSCKSIDGRLYPLVYFPGVSVISAYAELNDLFHFLFTIMTGSSMSTPAAAAVVYLILLRFEELGIDSTNALMRATLLANTYNRKRVFRVMNDFFTNANKWFLADHLQVPVQTNYKKCYFLQKNSTFTVALSWIEPPAAGLTNDLDLLVQFPDQSIWGNYGPTSDTTNNNEVVLLDAVAENVTISVMVSDTTASLAYFGLAITSSMPLQEVECNTTCTQLDPPIECDFDSEGNSGYYLCLSDGTLDRSKCVFHACDVDDNSVFTNGSCVVQNKTMSAPILVQNTYYVNLVLIKACKEHCYITSEECECSQVYAPAPAPTGGGGDPGYVRRASGSIFSFGWVQIVQICFFFGLELQFK